MSARWGWLLAAVGVLLGWQAMGWQGLVLALSIVAFWLLLQFSRTLRVMRHAAQSPVGHVRSAVELHARLHVGLWMAEVIKLTGSLGRRVDPGAAATAETWVWTDGGGDRVRVQFADGRCTAWSLERAAQATVQPAP
jgi:uncharacterized protein (DUF58 family)